VGTVEEGGSDDEEPGLESTEGAESATDGAAAKGPAGSSFQFVDSLNVSVATGILLHEFVSVRRRG